MLIDVYQNMLNIILNEYNFDRNSLLFNEGIILFFIIFNNFNFIF